MLPRFSTSCCSTNYVTNLIKDINLLFITNIQLKYTFVCFISILYKFISWYICLLTNGIKKFKIYTYIFSYIYFIISLFSYIFYYMRFCIFNFYNYIYTTVKPMKKYKHCLPRFFNSNDFMLKSILLFYTRTAYFIFLKYF